MTAVATHTAEDWVSSIVPICWVNGEAHSTRQVDAGREVYVAVLRGASTRPSYAFSRRDLAQTMLGTWAGDVLSVTLRSDVAA